VQGKDLEKIQLRLEKAQQTVHQNERDYANFARALADTTRKWEGEWKAYCDVRLVLALFLWSKLADGTPL
jgi:hypothetical protein